MKLNLKRWWRYTCHDRHKYLSVIKSIPWLACRDCAAHTHDQPYSTAQRKRKTNLANHRPIKSSRGGVVATNTRCPYREIGASRLTYPTSRRLASGYRDDILPSHRVRVHGFRDGSCSWVLWVLDRRCFTCYV